MNSHTQPEAARTGDHATYPTVFFLMSVFAPTMSHQSQNGDSAVLTVGPNPRADGSRTLTASMSLDSINK